MKRIHDHVGLATNDLERTVRFYVDELGFEEVSACIAADGTPIKFLRNGGLNYEIFQLAGATLDQTKRVDHMSFVSNDIEKDYEYYMKQGYECTSGGIQRLDEAWENGCRYFKIKGPGGEEIEFDQIL